MQVQALNDITKRFDIDVSSSGGGESGGGGSVSVPAKEVNFRDYDGTIVHSYTPAEFAALTAMPDNPDHSGDAIPLTAQGWNWSFERAQAYVAKYGRLEVGQMYATADGKTHVLIHLEQGRTSPILGCCPNGTVDVDWGDGTAHDTLTGTSVTTVQWTPMHEYAAPGDYDIKLTCSGTMGLYGDSFNNQYSCLLRYSSNGDARNQVYQNAIRAVYCADGVTNISSDAFRNCSGLSSITIPVGEDTIERNAFMNCYSLSSITIPDSVTSIDVSAFSNCYSLSSVIIPHGTIYISDTAFANCNSLLSIPIPDSVTTIGANAFANCNSLLSVTIPDSVMSIGTAVFNNCFSLSSVSLQAYVHFYNDGIFSGCFSLPSISLPNGIEQLGTGMFSGCSSLSSITIPDSVETINSGAFSGCTGLAEIHFLPATPPTVGSGAFGGVFPDCKIYVPAGSLEAYTSATNYPSSSTYTYIEE